jgi:hypothetical protein
MSFARRTTTGAVTLLAFAVGPLYGQQKASHLLGGTVGITNLHDHGTGMSLSAAYVLATQYVAVSFVPLDLGLFQKDSDAERLWGIRTDGGSVCTDRRTGQPINSDLCDPRFVFAASVDVLGAIPLGGRHSLGLGGGYRVGNSAGPYALAVAVFGPVNGRNWQLRGRLGEKLIDGAIGASLPLHCVTTVGWRHCR